MKKSYYYFILIHLLVSCISPDDVVESTDSDIKLLKELIGSQKEKIIGSTLEKEIKTNQQTSKKEFVIDSSFFESDFSILKGKDFGKVFHPNSYEKKQDGQDILYTRILTEKKGPVYLKIKKKEDGHIRAFSLEELDDNILFRSQITASYVFDDQQSLKNYSIKGNQKLIGLDQNQYEISGKIESH